MYRKVCAIDHEDASPNVLRNIYNIFKSFEDKMVIFCNMRKIKKEIEEMLDKVVNYFRRKVKREMRLCKINKC